MAVTLNVDIYLNFFVLYRGHSEVDRHFGSGKKVLRFGAHDGPITTVEEIFSSFAKLSNIIIQKIIIPQNLYKVKKLSKQVIKYFQWHLIPDGKIYYRELSGIGNWTMQTINYEILNNPDCIIQGKKYK